MKHDRQHGPVDRYDEGYGSDVEESSRIERFTRLAGHSNWATDLIGNDQEAQGPNIFRPARIRSLETAEQHLPRSSPWHSRALVLSWCTHILCLLLLFVEGGEFMASKHKIKVPYAVLLVGTFVIELAEIALFTSHLLSPSLFLTFQAAKASSWTIGDWPEVLYFLQHWKISPTADALRRVYLVAFVFMPAACWASFAYGFTISTREHRQRQQRIGVRRQRHLGILQHDIVPREGSNSDSLSVEVNQGRSLKHRTPAIMRALWLASPPPDCLGHISIYSRAWRALNRWVTYVSVSMLSAPLLFSMARMPGEPRHYFGQSPPDMMPSPSWDYPKVRIPRKQLYHDDDPVEPMLKERTRPGLDQVAVQPSRSAAGSRDLRRQDSGLRTAHRWLGPRYLCFLSSQEVSAQATTYATASVEEWMAEHNQHGNFGYVFVSYTRRQFYTQIWNDRFHIETDERTHQDAIARDTARLTEYGIRAAQAARVPAFWIDFECVQPEEDESPEDSIEDVYRICDIVRGAHSLAIVVAPPRSDLLIEGDQPVGRTSESEWLEDWGRRLWTVPEALLSPSEHRIAVYSVGSDEPELIAKRNFASRAYCDDAGSMQQLIDHYESSLLLTPLQFISLALECLQRRQTEKRMAGDVAYALMGLLRQRPKVKKSDSDFQAFARLSLANDSDRFLERLLCLSPYEIDAPWHDLQDVWGAKLWDIEPLCQVADVEDKQTVTLAGVFGTTINWVSLEPVDFDGSTTRKTFAWMFARLGAGVAVFIACLPFTLLIAWWLCSIQPPSHAQIEILSIFATLGVGISVSLWGLSIVISLLIPTILLRLQRGEIYACEARYFGIEGEVGLPEVERLLFGSYDARLVMRRQSGPASDMPGTEGYRHFTLVDTVTLMATTFYAREPPAVVMVCGRERGLVRCLLCSYEWDTQTFRRETTLRAEAAILERMPRMDGLKFAVDR